MGVSLSNSLLQTRGLVVRGRGLGMVHWLILDGGNCRHPSCQQNLNPSQHTLSCVLLCECECVCVYVP